jgi:hypothetical protein
LEGGTILKLVYPADGGKGFLRNLGNYYKDFTAS